jgi:outer membrane protein assembly factor BamB
VNVTLVIVAYYIANSEWIIELNPLIALFSFCEASDPKVYAPCPVLLIRMLLWLKHSPQLLIAQPETFGAPQMMNHRILSTTLALLSSTMLSAQVNVTTRSYDNRRSGANQNETILTLSNVGSNFGKLYTLNLDGQVYAQPLYVANLTVNGATHNVVYVATMNCSVYAFDADTGAALWHVRYGSPMLTAEIEDVSEPNIDATSPTGILSTPVIDVTTNTMYYVHANETKSGSTSTYAFDLEAIDIRTGNKIHSAVPIAGSYQTADLSSPMLFNPKRQNQRSGLALANGNVYFAFASHNDAFSYQGWVFAYSASTLNQTAVYVDVTVGTKGGIWQAGSAPAIDENGNIYYSTGNGSFGLTPNNLVQTGNSFIKLSPTLQLLDYFTPYDSATMNLKDVDLGSSGILLIPDPNNSAVTKYALGGGKGGVLYLADVNNLGGLGSTQDNVLQEFQAIYGSGTSHVHGTPIYINDPAHGPTVYVWGENDTLRMFTFDASTGLMVTTPYATSTVTAPATHAYGAMPGGFMCLTANGTASRILWASTPYSASAAQATVPGVLYAMNPTTMQIVWTDKTNDARDDAGMFAKDVPPVVANGKLYVVNFGPSGTTGAAGQLLIYGLLP